VQDILLHGIRLPALHVAADISYFQVLSQALPSDRQIREIESRVPWGFNAVDGCVVVGVVSGSGSTLWDMGYTPRPTRSPKRAIRLRSLQCSVREGESLLCALKHGSFPFLHVGPLELYKAKSLLSRLSNYSLLF
jgi:hypothetical protein